MAFWRWAGAIALLAPFAGPAFVREWPAIRRAWLPILFFGTCGTMVYNCIGYTGVRTSTATNAVLLQSVTPGVIPLFAWLLFRERIRLRTAGGLALSFAGVLAIVSRGSAASLAAFHFNRGDLWLIAAMFLWALYTIVLRRRPPELSALAFLAAMLLLSLPCLLPFYVWEFSVRGGFALTPATVATLAYYGTFPSIAAYLFWNRGVAQVGPNKAGLFVHLMPLFGALLSVLFLGETLYGYHFAGAALIFSGLYLTTRKAVTVVTT
jgi:drug/metabolite transporter (DMT)-like permease